VPGRSQADTAQYIHALAAQTNGVPLPPVPEVFGVRLPPPAECLTAVDFDLVPTRPPPDVKLYDEEIEEIEESDEDEDEEPVFDEPAPPAEDVYMRASEPAPVSAFGTPEPRPPLSQEDEDEDDDDGLFAGGDDEDEPMEPAAPEPVAVQRKLVEDDDYD
jgi:transcription initiation factor TFIID subunit 9B